MHGRETQASKNEEIEYWADEAVPLARGEYGSYLKLEKMGNWFLLSSFIALDPRMIPLYFGVSIEQW